MPGRPADHAGAPSGSDRRRYVARPRPGVRSARAARGAHRLAVRDRQLESLGLLPHGQPAPGVRAGAARTSSRGRAPAGSRGWAGRLGASSPGGVFAMGAASGWSRRHAARPAFAAVLTYVAGTGSALLGFLYLFVFSLGLTALLVAVGLSSGRCRGACRGAGRWTLWVKRRAGGVCSCWHGRVLLRQDGDRAVRNAFGLALSAARRSGGHARGGTGSRDSRSDRRPRVVTVHDLDGKPVDPRPVHRKTAGPARVVGHLVRAV